MFLNTLPMRVRVEPRLPWGAWLGRLQDEQLELRRYEHSPLADVQRWSAVPAGQPLFESFLVFQNYPMQAAGGAAGSAGEIGESGAGPETGDVDVAERGNYPLVLVVEPAADVELRLELDRRRFAAAAAVRLLGHLEALLADLVRRPEAELEELSLLSAAERQELVTEWQGEEGGEGAPEGAAAGGTLDGLLALRSRRWPGSPAVVWGAVELSHGELEARAARLGRRLRALGVGVESVVGLCVERSPALAVGILGVLKARGAYLPLDPGSPAERLRWMLDDAGARVVVSQPGMASGLGEGRVAVLLDAMGEEIAGAEGAAEAREAAEAGVAGDWGESLAYVIYTSGSTGRPKGVGVSHRSLVGYGLEMVRQLGLTASDRMLQFASPSFDVLVEELVPAWLAGGAVVFSERDLLLSVGGLEEVLERQRVRSEERRVGKECRP